MRGHIISLPRLLGIGIAVMAALVVFMAWSFASSSQPGEAIPDSVAATLRGGGCGTEVIFQCLDGTKVNPKCIVREITSYTSPGIYQQDKMDYCGAKVNGVLMCGQTSITSKSCSSSGP